MASSNKQLSIVGERALAQAKRDAETAYAAPEDVDRLVDRTSEEALICRLKRHDYPTIIELRRKKLVFIGQNELGLYLREPIDCLRCPFAYRQELWRAIPLENGYAIYEPVSAQTEYREVDGVSYLNSGHGRVTPRMINKSIATGMMQKVTLEKVRSEMPKNAAAYRARLKKAAAASNPPTPKATFQSAAS